MIGMLSFKQIPADVAEGWHSEGEPAWAKSFKAADRSLRYRRLGRDLLCASGGVAGGYWLTLEIYVVALAALVLSAGALGALAFRNYLVSRLAIQEADEKVKIIEPEAPAAPMPPEPT